MEEMAVNSRKCIFVAICLLVSYTQVQKAMAQTGQSVSQQCLDCICEAASGCDTLTDCKGDVCGPYRITQPYWSDSGRPTVDNDSNNADGGYSRCVGDRSCAARVVQGYMNRYSRDCNGDGVINCDDYALIHRLGCAGCSGTASPEYQNAYNSCMQSGGSIQTDRRMQSAPSVQPAPSMQAGGWMQPAPSVQPAPNMQAGGWMQPAPSVQPAPNMQAGGWAQPAPSVQAPCGK